MTSPDPETQSNATVDPTAREAAARQRFFALNLFRLSGVALVMFGFLSMMERFAFVQGDKARIMGAIFAFVGLTQALIVPRALASLWRTPRP